MEARMFASCTLALLVLARGDTPSRVTTPVAISIDASRAEVAHVCSVDGIARIWVESSDFDSRLAVSKDSDVSVEDEDSGGRPTPSIDVPVERGQHLDLVVTSTDGSGLARVIVIELAESDAVRARAAELRARVESVTSLSGTEGARERQRVLLETTEDVSTDPDLATSNALHLVLETAVAALADAGEHAAALDAAQRLLDVLDLVLPPESARRAFATLRVANALGHLGRHIESAAAYENALTILRRTLPRTDQALLAAESNRATALFASGLHVEAMAVWEEYLRFVPNSEDPDRRNVAQVRVNLAVTAFYLGDLPRARAEIDAARAAEGVIATGTPLDLQLRGTYAAIVAEQGDHRAGRALAEETLARARTSLPPGHIDLARAEVNFAIAQIRSGEDLAARDTLARTLEAPPEGLDAMHPLLVQSRLNLAAVDLRLDRPAAALEAIEDQLASLADAVPSTNIVVRTLSRNRALALMALGRLDEADEVEVELLAATRAILPVDHPERMRVELQRVSTLTALGRHEEARSAAALGATALRDRIALRASILSSREAESSQLGLWSSLDLALACLLDRHAGERTASMVELAFELCETARGLPLAAHRATRAVTIAGPASLALRDATRRAQVDLVRAVRSATAEELYRRIEARDEAERALLEELARITESPRPVSVRDTIGALRPHEVAIAWRVRMWSPSGSRRVGAIQEILTAFVVRSDGTVAAIDLGPVGAIADACRAWRVELERVPHDRVASRATSERLRALLIAPLAPHTRDATRWIVALDGPLLTIPLDALPTMDGAPHAVLGDAVRIVTTCSFVPSIVTRESAASESLVLVGDVAFGAAAADGVLRWPVLPATAREIDDIDAIWRDARATKTPPSILRGTDATPARFLAATSGTRWLHIATHGHFVEAEDSPGFLTASGEDPAFDASASVRDLLPLVRCELALAGANASNDGLLSAEGIASLDLGNCRLAVLSACETGRGEIVPGQGVASFQRALIAAGAQACATSLWSVPDEAARELMTLFYRAMWVEGLEPEDALWRAKRALHDRRAPARDWAGWVIASAFGGVR